MNKVICFNFQTTLSDQEINNIIIKSRFNPSHKELIRGVNATIESFIKPKIFYYLVNDKTEFEFMNKLDEDKCYAIAVVSLGSYIDKIQDIFMQAGEILTNMVIDSICLEILSKTYSALAGEIVSKYNLWTEKYLFPGETISIDATKDIIDKLKPDDVFCSDACVLHPAKTVTLVAQLSNIKCKSKHICDGCQNKTCTYRNKNNA